MLKVPEHQVAGHKAKDGILGPLVDDSGLFYKPLQNSDTRGSTELSFYSSLSSNPNVPHSFFPAFHGTKTIAASDGSGLHPHLVLEDLLRAFAQPSVIDVKIGARTWHLGDSADYIEKCLKKDRETSTIPLGFRISGAKDALSAWEPSRKSLQSLSADAVLLVLKKFVSSDAHSDAPDCAFASEVYAVVLDRLLQLKAWFEVQTLYHFYSCSVLIVYEKNLNHRNEKGKGEILVKLVDFAHAVPANGAIDHNFLGGLCSFINFIKQILSGLHR
ncbi:hypothetical protein VNO78_06754 [Psophocarpus tetragonolobus]|uniref:Inositol polyphosphate multikinase n=1 Tax=Psophocarpus tetragonolobus TaxID=3891 RepID=A0AAN9SUL6_PSOTE